MTNSGSRSACGPQAGRTAVGARGANGTEMCADGPVLTTSRRTEGGVGYEAHHRDRLLKHASRCASAFCRHELVVGILAGGSLAHGGTDRESDVDLIVIVRKLPSVETRAQWLSAITGQRVDVHRLPKPEERKGDEFDGPRDDPGQWMGTGGALLYFIQGEIERDLGRVEELLTAFSTRADEYLADLAHGVVLHDQEGFVAQCQQRLADYPESARVRLINHHWQRAEIAIHEDVQRALWRGDALHARDRLVEGTRHLIRMLFAMNRRYFRKGKGLDRLLPTFIACPPEAYSRLVQGLRETEPMRGAAVLMGLARDIIDRVDPLDALERADHWRDVCDSWRRTEMPTCLTRQGHT